MIILTDIFEQIAMYLKPVVSCNEYSTAIYLNSPDMFHIGITCTKDFMIATKVDFIRDFID